MGENINSESSQIFDDTEENKQIPNIIVAGVTGAGKSTLINAVFGNEFANTGIGKPVTDKIQEYKNDYICIWDTAGLEINNEVTERTIKEIKNIILKKAEESSTDLIHAIWYCINVASTRYQDAEIDFIKKLHKNNKVPFFIVLTQSYDEDASNTLEKTIREENKKHGLEDIEIIQVIAKDREFKKKGIIVYIAEQKCLKELIEKTHQRLPDYIKEGFIAAQQIDKEAKRNSAIQKLSFSCNEFEKNFWGKVLGVNIFLTDKYNINTLKDISSIYNTKFTDKEINDVIDKAGLKTDTILKQTWDDFKKSLFENSKDIKKVLEKFVINMIFPKDSKYKELLFKDALDIIIKSTGKFINVINDTRKQKNDLSIYSNLEWFLSPFSKKDNIENLKKYMEDEINDDLLNSDSVESLSNNYSNRFETMYIFCIGIAFINAIEEFWENNYIQNEKDRIEKVSEILKKSLESLKDQLNKKKIGGEE